MRVNKKLQASRHGAKAGDEEEVDALALGGKKQMERGSHHGDLHATHQ